MGVRKQPIKGVVLLSDPIYAEGVYAVVIGYIPTDENKDIAHYLIINTKYWVVEGSSGRLFEARGLCQAFHKELEQQDSFLARDIDIVERSDDDIGNRDPEWKATKTKAKPN